MRKFKMMRTEDQTGTSGCGHVANGMVGPDGTTVVTWIVPARLCDGTVREIKSRTIYNSPEDCALLHGHGGKTYLLFEDTGEILIDIAILQTAA